MGSCGGGYGPKGDTPSEPEGGYSSRSHSACNSLATSESDLTRLLAVEFTFECEFEFEFEFVFVTGTK